MNFDGKHSSGVRRFFIENACYWFEHYHIDALRIDAIHGIFDSSEKHFLRELKETVSARITDRPAYLIAESDLNQVRVIEPAEDGGYGLDAQWNDDFHHALHTLLTGEADGYYVDFGRFEQMAKALREGFVYSGQFSEFRGKEHGTSTAQRPSGQLVVFSQNHDQVGNRMLGDRLASSLTIEKLKLAAAMVLLSPNLPLLFMGEEYGETAPFQYFVSHSDPGLVEAVREGRRREFSKFQWKGEVPDPQSEETFTRSRINTALREEGHHRELFDFYKHLIKLRGKHPSLHSSGKERMEVREFPQERTLLMRRWHGDEEFMLAASFSDSPVTIKSDMPGGEWRRALSTHGEDSGQKGEISGIINGEIHLNPYCFNLYALVHK
jgi:maltooligosyltrehalose trehalohydrolase